jgi:hypothetical protein
MALVGFLLELLLGAEVVGVAARLLAAVRGAGRQAGVALAAHLLLPVELLGEGHESRLHHAAAQAQDEVERGLLLNVVIGQRAALLELLAGEDQPLLIRGNALLVLDLGLDVLDGVRRLNLEGDRLAREGLDEDLHRLEMYFPVTKKKKGGECEVSSLLRGKAIEPSVQLCCSKKKSGGRVLRKRKEKGKRIMSGMIWLQLNTKFSPRRRRVQAEYLQQNISRKEKRIRKRSSCVFPYLKLKI